MLTEYDGDPNKSLLFDTLITFIFNHFYILYVVKNEAEIVIILIKRLCTQPIKKEHQLRCSLKITEVADCHMEIGLCSLGIVGMIVELFAVRLPPVCTSPF